MRRKKVIVAMSGGVDSSVAALLLKKAGHEVIGITMRLYDSDEPPESVKTKGCCTIDDIEDARLVCHRLEIPHYVMDVREQFRKSVIEYFITEYAKGRTPHPCIACNDRVKFTFLLERARFLKADYLATGHYARIRKHRNTWHLLKGKDNAKDQSYVLFGMNQEQLAHTLLPIGTYTKQEIRNLAEEANLAIAGKPDSQEICFIQSGNYRQFLKNHIRTSPGQIVDGNGQILGAHTGIESFTIGQRQGLGLNTKQPMYVTNIDPERKMVIVGTENELLHDILWAEKMTYVIGQAPPKNSKLTVKIRYKSPEVPAIFYPLGNEAMVFFQKPVRAITPGQAVVLYQGEQVVGGGFINCSKRSGAPSSIPKSGEELISVP